MSLQTIHWASISNSEPMFLSVCNTFGNGTQVLLFSIRLWLSSQRQRVQLILYYAEPEAKRNPKYTGKLTTGNLNVWESFFFPLIFHTAYSFLSYCLFTNYVCFLQFRNSKSQKMGWLSTMFHKRTQKEYIYVVLWISRLQCLTPN